MKGTFFKKPLELKIQVEGEKWQQGQTVSGVLEVKNHGSDPVVLSGLRVDLAVGNIKKVHAKAADVFDVLHTVVLGDGATLKAGESATYPWSFATDINCPVTDTSNSLFILYGSGEFPDGMGHLQVAMHPTQLIEEFLDTFKVQFRFVKKTQRSSKGWVNVKLAPPDSRAFSKLEYVTVSFRLKDKNLEVSYEFHMKKVKAAPMTPAPEKEKLTHDQQLTPQEYLMPSGRPNFDRMESAIRESLDLVESKVPL